MPTLEPSSHTPRTGWELHRALGWHVRAQVRGFVFNRPDPLSPRAPPVGSGTSVRRMSAWCPACVGVVSACVGVCPPFPRVCRCGLTAEADTVAKRPGLSGRKTSPCPRSGVWVSASRLTKAAGARPGKAALLRAWPGAPLPSSKPKAVQVTSQSHKENVEWESSQLSWVSCGLQGQLPGVQQSPRFHLCWFSRANLKNRAPAGPEGARLSEPSPFSLASARRLGRGAGTSVAEGVGHGS